MTPCDLIIIGGGPGGYPAAQIAAAEGLNVVLIERDRLGGTCLNRGCIPTKAMTRVAEVAMTVTDAADYGVETVGCPVSIDYQRATRHRDEVVTAMREGLASTMANVNIVIGEAVVDSTEPPTVTAAGTTFTAPRLIVATGAAPARLPIEGADLALTSDDLTTGSTLPESLVVIGGGVIGLEFASIFNALGSKVTIVEFLPEILPPCDAEIAKRLRTALKRRGIDIITDAAVTALRPGMEIDYQRRGKTATLQAEAVLMAVGRRAVVPRGLNVELNHNGSIKVDPETFETSAKGVYAVGDVNGICQLAHAATAQAERVMGRETDLSVIPSAVFTSPEVAMVGKTEKQALESGHDITVGKAMFRSNGKAQAMGETDGLVKVIVDRDNDLLLGAFIVGPHAADLIEELSLAMSSRLPVHEILSSVHAHPTLSETVTAALAAAR
jgi:dihydrolipoamide dehydrogenase